ncbi:hypothetical protein SAMN06296386_10812 [Lachnospiraceae bacterium]|nr:hypothetical protein SAMN06296386_10812 [Lachnospiraceae bacterium]
MLTWLLLKQIFVMFLMMACGYLLVRVRLLKPEDSRSLSVVVVYLIMPCVIVKAFQVEFTDSIRSGFIIALISAVVIHILLFILTAVVGKILNLNRIERASIIYSNAGNLIVPLVTAVLGEEWVIYASAFMCVQMVFLWTHCQSLIKGEEVFSFKKVITNINLIAVILGFSLLIFNIKLPGVVMDTLKGLSATIGPMSMIMLGIMLAGIKIEAILCQKRIYLVCLLKMIIVPALVMFIMKLSGLYSLTTDGKMIGFISILALIAPAAMAVTQMAQLYNSDAEYSGSINAVTTLSCIVTMPVMTQLYMML